MDALDPKRERAALAALTVAALAVRVVGLGTDGVDSQEATYLQEVLGGGSFRDVLFHPSGLMHGHPPLFRLLFAPWAGLVGDDLFWLRLPSAIAGAATVPLLAALAGGGRTGLLAGTLLGGSRLHVLMSRSAMPYAPAVLLGVASFLLWRRLRRTDASRGSVAATSFGLAACHAGAILMHPFALIFGAAQGVVALSEARTNRRFAARTVVAGVLTVALCAPGAWLFLTGTAEHSDRVMEAMRAYGVLEPDGGIAARFGAYFLTMLGGALGHAWLAPVAIGAAALAFREAADCDARWLLAATLGAFGLVFGLHTAGSMRGGGAMFAARYFVFVLPALYVAMAAGVAALAGARVRHAAAAGLVACAVAGAAVGVRGVERPALVDRLGDLRAELEDGDAVIVQPALFFALAVQRELDVQPWFARELPEEWRPLPGGRAGTWLGVLIDRRHPAARRALTDDRVGRIWIVDVDESPLGWREISEEPSRRCRELLAEATVVADTDRGGVRLTAFAR